MSSPVEDQQEKRVDGDHEGPHSDDPCSKLAEGTESWYLVKGEHERPVDPPANESEPESEQPSVAPELLEPAPVLTAPQVILQPQPQVASFWNRFSTYIPIVISHAVVFIFGIYIGRTRCSM